MSYDRLQWSSLCACLSFHTCDIYIYIYIIVNLPAESTDAVRSLLECLIPLAQGKKTGAPWE